MVSLLRLSLYLLCLSLHSPLTTSSSYPNSSAHLCHEDERFAMFEFKNSLAFDVSSEILQQCGLWGQVPYVKTASWKAGGNDCCQWDGVTCNPLTGHVVELDLSCSQLRGTIPMNSTLFTLRHLQSLNLAYNDFFPSSISPEFGRFSRLKRLNLSNSFFTGEVPLTIAQLSQLSSLDLSQTLGGTLKMPDFDVVFGNITGLRELYLGYVISDATTLPSLMNLSSLIALDLNGCKFFGPLPAWIWNITREIHLCENQFTGKLPSMVDISKLSQLIMLDLSQNLLDGEVPFWLFSLPLLQDLDLSINQFSGQLSVIEDVVTNLSLTNLSSLMALSKNQFTGELPSMVDISKFSRLMFLDLSQNLLDGKVPSWLFSLPSLNYLYLADNKFFGQLTIIEDVASNTTTLWEINLSMNKIEGSIPNSIFELVSLETLDLSSNNLSGIIELDMFCKLKNLTDLNLSRNGLSLLTKSNSTISSNVATCPRLFSLQCSFCNITEFPDFLRTQENLTILDLSNNKIHGDIPKWAQNIGKDSLSSLDFSGNFLTGDLDLLQWKNLQYIDLHSNMFEGPIPIPPPLTEGLLASNNRFTGEIPSLICTLAGLSILNLSNNSLSGEIPRCFKSFSDQLTVLDLKSNEFHGTLPSSFGKCSSLRTLDLNGNQLEGQLPPSLLSCKGLEVLDVGNNNFNGTFPYWLGFLPKLQVLILRSNNFHGNIGTSKAKHLFSTLRILDLSSNGFNSTLPSSLLHCFKAMMNSTKKIEKLQYLGESNYEDSVMLTVKGQDIEFDRILTIITTIDFSNNKLEGEIPRVIGNLVSLRWLNLAHNNFTGRIPPSLASLSELESLDLSSNMLDGRIPRELASLTFLEFFNVSQNRLVGPIPQGKQFATFQNNSYLGNLGLCGNLLSKKCGEDEAPSDAPPRMDQDDNDFEYKGAFGWVMVGIGYGCGMIIGLVAGYYIVITRNPIWLLRLARQLKNASNQLF